MRILLICGAGIVSGKEIISLNLVRELKAKGHECSVIVSNWGSEDFRNRLRHMEVTFFNLRVGFISKKLTWSAFRMTMIQAFYMPTLLVKYWMIKRKVRPEVVLHTNFHHAFLLYPASHGERNIYWSHEITGDTSFYRWLFRLLNRRMDRFVAVSNATAESLRRLIDNRKIVVVKNGINIPSTPVQRYDPRSEFVFAVVGQLSKAKGIEVILKAMANIPKSRFKLRIIGSGTTEYEIGIKALASQLGIFDHCEWYGFVDNVDKIYAGVNVVVVPSIFPDPYPTTVMEAGLRGIPVIASAIGGLPEMIVDGVNGFLFQAGNPEDLREKIEALLTGNNFELLRKQSLDFALRNFTTERFGNEFTKLISEKAV